MFWKHKKNKKKPIFSYREDDRRAAYRVFPLPQWPVSISYKGRDYKVLMISAAGFAVKDFPRNPGVQLSVEFSIKDYLKKTPIMIELISKEGSSTHCRYINLSTKLEEIIHFYVLSVQKEVLKTKASQKQELGDTTTQIKILPFSDDS